MKEKEMEAEDLDFSPENLAKLIELADAGTINSTVAKEVFEKIFAEDIDNEGINLAVSNRLYKAAGYKFIEV